MVVASQVGRPLTADSGLSPSCSGDRRTVENQGRSSCRADQRRRIRALKPAIMAVIEAANMRSRLAAADHWFRTRPWLAEFEIGPQEVFSVLTNPQHLPS
jgi:hypothetical protein